MNSLALIGYGLVAFCTAYIIRAERRRAEARAPRVLCGYGRLLYLGAGRN
jgi:hypothetical protein